VKPAKVEEAPKDTKKTGKTTEAPKDNKKKPVDDDDDDDDDDKDDEAPVEAPKKNWKIYRKTKGY